MPLTQQEKMARNRVCLPLDGLNTLAEVKERVAELKEVVGLFKIGKESFTKFGPAVIELIHNSKREVFLDLKYHDIPNTVKGAAAAAAALGVLMFNVHASGGLDMMRAAKEGAMSVTERKGIRCPKILGVTVLTSIDGNILRDDLGILESVEDHVLRLAQLTNKAGLDGIVCSAADLYAIKDKLPEDFMYVTPGIKGVDGEAGADQKRVFTPGNAVKDGSTILVVGRTITGFKTPEERIEAGYKVLRDMARYL